MSTQLYYGPLHEPHHRKMHFGWNSCLLLMANLMLIAFYTIVPAVSFWLLFALVTLVAVMGIASAVMSIMWAQFWISKVYAACGLIGNMLLPLWLLLTF